MIATWRPLLRRGSCCSYLRVLDRAASTKAAAVGDANAHSIGEALSLVKGKAQAKFDETVEVSLALGIDPRKPNQSIRVMATLPHGIGKTTRVAVFARGADADKARSAGAEIVGAEDLVEAVLAGNIDFDRCLATPDMMPLLGRAGRVLGPRGLMPNPKLGTVTRDVEGGVKLAKAGQVQLRAAKDGRVRAGVGKVSFELPALLDNVRALMVAISNAKPEGAKGTYIKGMHLSSTMGAGVAVDAATVDPGNARFMSA